jgi:predicted metalloendopeptidase
MHLLEMQQKVHTVSVCDMTEHRDMANTDTLHNSGGLKFSYQAFTTKQPRSNLEKREFFTSFAQTWCSVQRRKSAVSSVLSDTHAPSKFRVLGGLSQFPPFADAFQCPAGAPMAPTTRCSLW